MSWTASSQSIGLVFASSVWARELVLPLRANNFVSDLFFFLLSFLPSTQQSLPLLNRTFFSLPPHSFTDIYCHLLPIKLLILINTINPRTPQPSHSSHDALLICPHPHCSGTCCLSSGQQLRESPSPLITPELHLLCQSIYESLPKALQASMFTPCTTFVANTSVSQTHLPPT